MNEIQYYLNKGINKNFVCSKDCPSGECRIPTMGGMHNRFLTYEEYTLVYDEDTLVAYISKRCVPKGVEITNRKYWLPMNVSGYADDNIIVLADRDEYGQTISYNLATAVESIAEVSRNPGVLLSFFSTEDGAHWELWLYNALNTDDWSDLSQWRSIYNTLNKFVGWYNSLEDLQKIYVGTFPGHYAIVGEDLSSITVYEGRKTGWYPLDVNLYQEALNELIRNIDEGSIYLTNEQKGKFKAFMCGFNEEECPCGGNSGSGSGSGEGGSEGTTHVEIHENPYDDAEIRQLISDVQSRLNNLILITDDDVRSTVSSMIKSMEHFIDTFGWNEMFKDSGWSEEMKAYIQLVGFTDKLNNQVSWSEFYQDFLTLSEVVRNIKIAEDSGEEINYEVIEGMIRTAIENNQTLNTISSKWAITDEGENVLRWAVSQLQTVAGEDHSLADMFAAVRSENTQAIADLNLDAKLDAAKVELTTSINGVRDSLSGYIAKSELDNTSSTIYSKLDDRYATILTAVTKDANGKVTSSITFGADNVLLNEDGSGYLAGGNINWNTAGDTTLNGEINAESGTIGGWIIANGGLKSVSNNIYRGSSSEIFPGGIAFESSNTYGDGISLVYYNSIREDRLLLYLYEEKNIGEDNNVVNGYFIDPNKGFYAFYNETVTDRPEIEESVYDGLEYWTYFYVGKGSVLIGDKIKAAIFNEDGSGSLANRNLSWDGNGNISLTESFIGSIFNVLREGYRTEDNAIFLDETGLLFYDYTKDKNLSLSLSPSGIIGSNNNINIDILKGGHGVVVGSTSGTNTTLNGTTIEILGSTKQLSLSENKIKFTEDETSNSIDINYQAFPRIVLDGLSGSNNKYNADISASTIQLSKDNSNNLIYIHSDPAILEVTSSRSGSIDTGQYTAQGILFESTIDPDCKIEIDQTTQSITIVTNEDDTLYTTTIRGNKITTPELEINEAMTIHKQETVIYSPLTIEYNYPNGTVKELLLLGYEGNTKVLTKAFTGVIGQAQFINGICVGTSMD